MGETSHATQPLFLARGRVHRSLTARPACHPHHRPLSAAFLPPSAPASAMAACSTSLRSPSTIFRPHPHPAALTWSSPPPRPCAFASCMPPLPRGASRCLISFHVATCDHLRVGTRTLLLRLASRRAAPTHGHREIPAHALAAKGVHVPTPHSRPMSLISRCPSISSIPSLSTFSTRASLTLPRPKIAAKTTQRAATRSRA